MERRVPTPILAAALFLPATVLGEGPKPTVIVQHSPAGGAEVMLSPNARWALSMGRTSGLSMWSLPSGKKAWDGRWRGTFAFSPDDRLAVCDEGQAFILDAATGRTLLKLDTRGDPEHPTSCGAITFDAEGKRIVIAGQAIALGAKGEVGYRSCFGTFDASTGAPSSFHCGDRTDGRSPRVSAEGRRALFAARVTGPIPENALYSTEDGAPVAVRWPGGQLVGGQGSVLALREPATLRLFDYESGKVVGELASPPFPPETRILGASRDGRWFCVAGALYALPAARSFRLAGDGGCSFSRDGRYFAHGAAKPGPVFYDTSVFEDDPGDGGLAQDPLLRFGVEQMNLDRLALDDGRAELLGARYGTIRRWNLRTGAMDKLTFPADAWPRADGAVVSYVGGDAELRARERGGRTRSFALSKAGAVGDVIYSADGGLLAALRREDLDVLELASGRRLGTFPRSVGGDPITCLAFGPAKNLLAVVHPRRENASPARIVSIRLADGHVSELFSIANRYDERERSRLNAPVDLCPITVHPSGRFVSFRRGVFDVSAGRFVKERGPDSPLAFSPDGARYASLPSGGLQVGDAARLEALHERPVFAHALADPHNLVFGRAGALVLTSGGDGLVKLWRTETRELVATLIGTRDDRFVLVTPDGYYMSSANGLAAIAFRLGERVYPAEAFDVQLNRPDIVLERLGWAGTGDLARLRRIREKRLKRLGVRGDGAPGDRPPPEAVILGPPLPPTTAERRLSLRTNVRSKEGRVARLHLYVNDVPVYGRAGLAIRPPVRTSTRTLDVTLSRGMNKIEVSAADERGVESSRDTRWIGFVGKSAPPVVHVLAIGVSKYRDARYDLGYAGKDAADIAAFFGAPGARKVVTRTILDAEATRANILAARSFLDAAGVDDTVIVFFAGHGVLGAEDGYYFGTTDMDFSQPERAGLGYEDMESLLDGITARRKLLLIDTCHSGEVDEDEGAPIELARGVTARAAFRGIGRAPQTAASPLLVESLFADLRRGTGATVISSSSGRELALEAESWKNGVFTYAILDGLRSQKADANKDGRIRVSELKEHVIGTVRELTLGAQTPTSRSENLADDFEVHR